MPGVGSGEGARNDNYGSQPLHPPGPSGSLALCRPASTYPPPRMQETGSRFPQELVNRVLDSLWDSDLTLRQCMLVSRAWHSYVVQRGLLSGTLRLSNASALADLLKTLPAECERLRNVHTVHFNEASTAPWLHRAPLQLGAALQGATALYLIKWRTTRVPLHPLVLPAFTQFCAVRQLYLKDCVFANATEFQRFLSEFSQLRVLGLLGVYVFKRCGGTVRCCKPPPRLEQLVLENSAVVRPGKEEENVAGCLAEWFANNEARLEALRDFELEITRAQLQEGELASLGELVEVVGPHVHRLQLNFVDPTKDTLDPADWGELKLGRCIHVEVLQVFRTTSSLHELALLSPVCRIRVLELRRWVTFPYEQKTDWAALVTALESDTFAGLQKIVNSRLPQTLRDMCALKAFVQRMQVRDVEVEDRTEFPVWDWKDQDSHFTLG